MDTSYHTIENLFAQLGLENSEQAIDKFIDTHAIEKNTKLADASFWTPSQTAFIQDSLEEDADWSEVIDQLDVMLRK